MDGKNKNAGLTVTESEKVTISNIKYWRTQSYGNEREQMASNCGRGSRHQRAPSQWLL